MLTVEEKARQKAVAAAIDQVCDEIRQMLQSKNAAYGNSALAPVRVFSELGVLAGLRVRMDDKLSRIRNAAAGADLEDARLDLIGYLVLERVYGKLLAQESTEER